jgi:MFS family permease
VTNTTALLVDAYPAEQMPLILGLNVSVAAGSSICGPLIGGALVSVFGWRALFLSAVPLGLFSFAFGFRVLTMRVKRSSESFDYTGAFLSFIALGSLVFALSEGGTSGWESPLIVGCFVVSAVSWVAFVRTQLGRPHPLVDLSILRNPDLVLSYYANFMMAIVQMATLLLVSLFLQAVFEMDALAAGIHITALAAGLMGGTACSTRLIGRIAPRHVAAAGMGLIALASLFMSIQFAGTVDVIAVSGLMGLIGLGVGLFMTPNTTSIMSSVGPQRRGIANGVRSMVQNMGFVVGTALSLAIVSSPLSEAARHAVYSGQSHLLEPDQLDLFRGQYLIAFRVLTGVAISAVVACLCRLRADTSLKLDT